MPETPAQLLLRVLYLTLADEANDSGEFRLWPDSAVVSIRRARQLSREKL